MQCYNKQTFRLALSGALIMLMALATFLGGGNKTFAAACDGTTPIFSPAPGTEVTNCDVGIYITAVAGVLSAIPAANVTLTTGTLSPLPTGYINGTITGGAGTAGSPYAYTLSSSGQAFNLSFATTLDDGRGGLPGWNMTALASGLPTGSSVIFNSVTQTCNTDTACFPAAGSLSTPTFPATVGTSTPLKFIGAPDSTTSNNVGNYTLVTAGNLELPNTITAGTAIHGTLTITLSDTTF